MASGVGASGATNSVDLITNQNLDVSGFSASLETTSVVVTADSNTAVTGLSGTSANNGVSLITEVNQLVSGLEGLSGTEDVVVTADANVPTTGVGASSSVNGVSEVIAKANVFPTGVSISTAVGQVLVYGRIVPNQNPQYSNVTPEVPEESESTGWTNLAA